MRGNRDRAIEICAMMASSSDLMSSIPAWRLADASENEDDCRLAKQAVTAIQMSGAIHETVRGWWAEAECLLRDGWCPGQPMVTFHREVPVEPDDIVEEIDWIPGVDEPVPLDVERRESEDALDHAESVDYFAPEPDDEVLS